jgi:type I restriction enzyme M protein
MSGVSYRSTDRILLDADRHLDFIPSRPLFLRNETAAASLDWSVSSELRFLEWKMGHLAPGACCNVIIPDGLLFRRDRAYRCIRERLLTEFTIRGVVRLPAGIFSDASGIRVSLLAFGHLTTHSEVIRYYEVPPLPRGSGSRRNLPADVLDGAIAWMVEGKPDHYSWEVRIADVKQGNCSLDLRWPGGCAANAFAGTFDQLSLFPEQNDFDYTDSGPLAPWIEERGERAKRLTTDRLLGVSKQGLTDFKGMPPTDTHRYRCVQAGDFAYNPMRAELGSIALCRGVAEEGWVSPDYIVFRLTTDAPFDAEYLLRFLKSRIGRFEASRHSHGSIRRRLRYGDLGQIVIPHFSTDSRKSSRRSGG